MRGSVARNICTNETIGSSIIASCPFRPAIFPGAIVAMPTSFCPAG
jgi:hypothetical protein